MRDYSLNSEERKQFILYYTVVDNNLIVKLASGEDYVIPYNEVNVQKVLSRMEKQVENIPAIEDACNKKFKSYSKWSLCNIGLLVINGVSLLLGGLIPGLSIPTIAVLVYMLASNIAGCIDAKLTLRDIKKHKYFVENQEEFNNNKVRENNNIFLGVSEKAIERIKQTPTGQPIFDINAIAYYSLTDLQQLIKNIKRDSAFNFSEEQPVETGEKEKVFFKTQKNNNK